MNQSNDPPSAAEFWRNTGAKRLRVICASEAGTNRRGDQQDTDSARKGLEAEFEAIGSMVSALRSHYNTLSYINRLPTEMLVRIFVALRHLEPLEDKIRFISKARLYTDGRNLIGWLKVTHVCQQWRQAALAYPRLWSDITFSLGPQWRDAMLSRSRAVPISMTIRRFGHTSTTPDREQQDTMYVISRHLERTRHLHLSVPPDDWEPIIPLLCHRAPVLEDVRLVVGDAGSSLHLPSGIFGQHAPNLHRLNVFGWHISWSALTFNLVELRLGRIRDGAAQRHPLRDFREFLDAMQRLPMLEVLELECVLPTLPSTVTLETPYGPVINLPRLKSLKLYDDILACALALKHLSLPSTAEQAIQCQLDETAEGHVEFIFPWLDSRLKSSSITGLWMSDLLAGDGIYIFAWDRCIWKDDDHGYPQVHPDTPPVLNLTVFASTTQDSVPHIIRTICRKLPLTDLSVLSITSGATWETQHWFDAFGQLEKVTQNANASGG
ncbi:hypothetical protein DENSPDRAFT_848903 [Dentipellis sp. KUC8613]|nr:hypothetical protein DENSPDRAFT_848903 [Dentipellis sp. KUC8613]